MKLNEIECPDCNKRMMVFYDNNVYVSHGCKHCKFFHKLSNLEDFVK